MQNTSEPIIAWLVCLDKDTGIQQFTDFPLYPKKNLLGKHPLCDICLDNDSIDEIVASIRYKKAQFTLTNFDADTLVLVNDTKEHQYTLEDSDKITIGEHTFQFHAFSSQTIQNHLKGEA